MSISNFEDIKAWQMARKLTKRIYQATATGALSHDRPLREQLRRASVSVVSNIAEGFERDGNKEFRNFLSIAKASVGEIRAQLIIAHDLGLISNSEFEELSSLSIETGRMIGGFIRYLGKSPLRGFKHKELS